MNLSRGVSARWMFGMFTWNQCGTPLEGAATACAQTCARPMLPATEPGSGGRHGGPQISQVVFHNGASDNRGLCRMQGKNLLL